MQKLNRRLPWLVGILAIIILERALAFPRDLYGLVIILLLIVGLSVWQITDRKLYKLKFWNVLILPFILTLSGVLFLTFLEGFWVRHFQVVIIGFLLWLLLEVFSLRFHDPTKYQPHALENISNHVSIVTAFFSFSGLLSLIIILAIPNWLIGLLSGIVGWLLTYQLFWASGLSFKQSWLHLLVILLLLVEFFITIQFLPSSIYVGGMLMTICYYLTSGILRNWLHGIKEAKVVRRYVALGTLAFILILASAKWS